MKLVFSLFVSALLLSTVFLTVGFVNYLGHSEAPDEDLYFGVTYGGNTTSEAKLLIDKVKGFTNVFVLNSYDISENETAVNEICDYAAEANMHIMVYFNFIFYNYTFQFGNLYNSSTWEHYGVSPWHMDWLNNARERWGDKFLGIYLYDEPGGKQLDTGYWGGNMMTFSGRNITSFYFSQVANYGDAANRFVRGLMRSGSMQHAINSSIPDSINTPMPVFTADNALYWFDYLAGYNAVFVELGWNNSRAQQIALCRGAATVQNRDWGAIITWTYRQPPYIGSGPEILDDMITAYRSGAKYVLLFNFPKYPEKNPYGILGEEHFKAMKLFWDYIHNIPRDSYGQVDADAAFVLPKDYGWGMRSPHDSIWGFWPPDDLSPIIWDRMTALVTKYGFRLDIIYDDPQFNFTSKYSKIYYLSSSMD